MIICGIDVSFTGTAVAIGTAESVTIHRFSTKPNGEGAAARVKRIESIVSQVVAVLESTPPAAIFLEHYSFGSRNGGEMLGELGGVMRWHLTDFVEPFEVAPLTLKKFVCGTGSAKKEQMIAHVFRQWGKMFDTNDHADAFGLYRMGLVAAGLVEASNQAQREAVKKAVGGRKI